MATIDSVELYLSKGSTSGWDVHVDIHDVALYSQNPTIGDILGSKTVSVDSVSSHGSQSWVTFTFDSPITITESGFYAIHVWCDTSAFQSLKLYWYYSNDWNDATGGTPYVGKERGWFYRTATPAGWLAGYEQAYKINCTDANNNSAESPLATYRTFSPTISYGQGIRTYLLFPPEKPTTPAPEDEEGDVVKTTENLTWADGGGDTETFNIYFGTTSGSLTELETGIDVGSPTWTAPMVVLEISDYNPEALSGHRSPIAGDELTDGTTTYTIWDVKRGDLVNVQYEAKLYAFRVGPAGTAGGVFTNGVEPDVNDPQAVSVTLNDEWYFTGEAESAWYPYATRYYWRVDAVNEAGTTTGDEWYFDTQFSWLNERPPDYNETLNWGYTDGSYQWADFHTSGGGRYKEQLVIVGHNSIYVGDL